MRSALAALFALVWRSRLEGYRVVRVTGWRSALVDDRWGQRKRIVMLAALMAALALCANAANAATNDGGGRDSVSVSSGGGSRTGLAISGRGPATLATASSPADSCHHCICFSMPRAYLDGRPLSDGFREWRVGYQNQSLVWRDSVAVNGAAWGRDLANFAKWRPDAQIKWFRSGYARPGERVCVDSLPPVMSLHWPYWYRAQSRTSVWSDISNPCGPFRNNDW